MAEEEKPLRDVIFSFAGEEKANEYTLTKTNRAVEKEKAEEEKPLREVMFSFVGEERAKVYTLTNTEYACVRNRFGNMLSNGSNPKWLTLNPYGQRHEVFINMDCVKRIIF